MDYVYYVYTFMDSKHPRNKLHSLFLQYSKEIISFIYGINRFPSAILFNTDQSNENKKIKIK